MAQNQTVVATSSKPQPLIYRINVAMAHLGVSRTTIYRLVNSGDLELVKIGRRASGITVASINAHLKRNTVPGSAAMQKSPR